MQLKKRNIYLTLMIFLVCSTFLLAGFKTSSAELTNHNHLKQKILEKGYVRIIIKLDVPDIGSLTATSTGFLTGILDESYSQEAFNADLALEKAIIQTGDSVLHRLNGSFYRVNRRFTTLPCLALTVSSSALEKLEKHPAVIQIFEDKAIPLPKSTIQENSPDISEPFLRQSTTIVGADVAWGMGFTGSGWYVAILDTGILSSHEMFQGKHIVEQCYALGDDWYDRVNGSCPNGGIEMAGPGSAAPYQPRFGHGTHVAGIATGNNQNDMFGVAKDANIIAVQVFSFFPYENEVLSWISDQLKGLEYVYTIRNTYRIASVNMSLGGERYFNYCDTDMRTDAINNLRAAGIATVIASGNEGHCDSVGSPACISSAITINGTDKQDNDYQWGNWHEFMVDLLAPGASINSANSTGNYDYSYRSGTSMATPHVAGAWAILKQVDETLSIDDILTLFQDTGEPIQSTRCPGVSTKSRIDVGGAIMALLTLSPPDNINGDQFSNKAFLSTEYVNQITWERNPLNESKNVTAYRIYKVQNSNLTLLLQMDSNTFSYWHRNVEKRQEITYALTAVDDKGQESLPAYFTLEFGTSQ